MIETPAPQDRGRRMWNLFSLAIMAFGVAALIAAGVLIARGVLDGGPDYSGPGTVTAFGDLEAFLTPQPSPTGQPTPVSDAPLARLVIPRFDIDAPIVVRGVDDNGVMEAPDGPSEVAWYDFTARPGVRGNAVFSGHVDYVNVGPAVFWNLRNLELGDVIEVHLEDGTTFKYQVNTKTQVSASLSAEEVNKIVGPTPQEVITLITCGGTFDASVGQYDQRVIVRAEPLADQAVQTPDPAARERRLPASQR